MPLLAAALLLCLLGTPLHVSGMESGSAAAQNPVVVTGVVTDQEDGRPLAGASVRLRQGTDESWVGAEVVTDARGIYRTPALRPGSYELRVQLLGYSTLEDEVEVAGASPMSVTITLAREALEIDGVAVVARRNPFLEEGGFYERQRAGLGLTFTREELEGRGFATVTDVFRSIAGVDLRLGDSPTSPFVWFRRLGCRPDIVINDANYGPNTRLDDLVDLRNVQGLEVYRGASTNPATLSTSACGAVVVWTMTDDLEHGEEFAWSRVVVGAVVLALVQLFRP